MQLIDSSDRRHAEEFTQCTSIKSDSAKFCGRDCSQLPSKDTAIYCSLAIDPFGIKRQAIDIFRHIWRGDLYSRKSSCGSPEITQRCLSHSWLPNISRCSQTAGNVGLYTVHGARGEICCIWYHLLIPVLLSSFQFMCANSNNVPFFALVSSKVSK